MWQNIAKFKEFIAEREPLAYLPDVSYAYDLSLKKSRAILEPLISYIQPFMLSEYAYSLALHYFICEPFTYLENGVEATNPLYVKYDIANKESGLLVNSASDESSSASYETSQLQGSDFTTIDLMRTRYGLWVYQLIESLDIGGVRL